MIRHKHVTFVRKFNQHFIQELIIERRHNERYNVQANEKQSDILGYFKTHDLGGSK